MEKTNELMEWLREVQGFSQADWDKLPDIGLYMDQVQTYIERQLSLFTKKDKDKLLTPAMINNYIKDSLIPRAESKKYSQTHVSLLIMIATLKQVLSMQDLKHLISDCRTAQQAEELYSHYLAGQKNDLVRTSAEVLDRITAENLENDQMHEFLRRLALDLSVEARNRILMSEKIIEFLSESKIQENNEDK